MTISFGRNQSKMSDSGEGSVIYFLTSITQCHLGSSLLVNISL